MMSSPSSPTPLQPSRLSVPMRLGRYMRQVYNAKHTVLQYHRSSCSLSAWVWYVTFSPHANLYIRIDFAFRPMHITRERVRPEDLREHCVSNNLRRPCCLCPLKDLTKPALVEASFEIAKSGVLSGEYIAKCAKNNCGYLGAWPRLVRISDHELTPIPSFNPKNLR